MRFVRFAVLGVAVLMLAGCRTSSLYYDAMEQVGIHKRHILRDRVEAAQDDQRAAEEQFQSAYERFKSVSGYAGGDLEDTYNALADELESSEDRAEDVRDRIDSIEEVAADLFDEWKSEIDQIQTPRLRRASSAQLRDTQKQYARLIGAMKRAEAKMDPVLVAFRDQVLFLKHNLNAKAIAALQGSVGDIEDDVAALIDDIRVSIREAETFLDTMPENA